MGLQAHECWPEKNVAFATGFSIMLLKRGLGTRPGQGLGFAELHR
jgi:hypothetical protein